MSDILKIFGKTYSGVEGIIATDNSDTDLTYVRPQGTKSIHSNGTGIDVAKYASVNVIVPSDPNLQIKSVTYTPTTSQQNDAIHADTGYDGLSEVDITINAVPLGVATAPSAISDTGASVSSVTNTITLTKTVSVTPNVSVAGYVESGTAGNSSVSLSASVNTKGATTYNTSSSDQTIPSGTYLRGTQTIKAVTVSGLSAENIASGVTVKVGDANDDDRIASVTGTLSFSTIYKGSGNPSASTGQNGDLYLKTS